MAGPHPAESTSARGERWLVAALVTAVVVARSAVLVFWEQGHFDSDQAIIGLMAKHLIEGRAFPLFYYGQNYMLGVQAWLAAPLFLVGGVSVMMLKLPLLAINVLVALLLLRIFEREVGLRPLVAAVPTLFFALPPPGTAAILLQTNGGSVEPLAYALLLWLTRRRPNWGGFILGIGFLHREFTLYALAALLALEALRGTLFTREGIMRRLVMLRAAAEVWLVVQWLMLFASAAGPATTVANLRMPRNNVVNLSQRMCIDLHTLPSGLWALLTQHWPSVFGARVHRLVDLSIRSTGSQGLPFGWLVLAAVIVLPIAVIGVRIATERRWRPQYDPCAYLVLVGLFSSLGYVIARCGELDIMRYDVMSPLGAAGLGAWFLCAAPARTAIRVWIALVAAYVAMVGVPHARLLAEYISHPPVNQYRVIADSLEARGIRYASSDYWVAYAVTFLTQERVVVASEDVVRIFEYQRLVDEHRDQAFVISRHSWCEGARPIVQAGVYFCPPGQ